MCTSVCYQALYVYTMILPCCVLSVLWILKGEMERSEGGSITEGIGQGRVTGNLATCEGIIDGAFLVRLGLPKENG